MALGTSTRTCLAWSAVDLAIGDQRLHVEDLGPPHRSERFRTTRARATPTPSEADPDAAVDAAADDGDPEAPVDASADDGALDATVDASLEVGPEARSEPGWSHSGGGGCSSTAGDGDARWLALAGLLGALVCARARRTVRPAVTTE
ncbi:MAG: hypothetical protein IPJ34_42620 [Myxococcales bacterium]|nr:hypothetical protein [Myxococcales bacterium]